MKIKFFEIELAFEFSSSTGFENEAYISLDTGKIYWFSDEHDCDERPDDFEESDRYLRIPPKKELVHSRYLVREFIANHAPHLEQDVHDIFSRRGAYRRYKDLLFSHQLLEQWYDFENQSETDAITEWCHENGIELLSDVIVED